MAKFSLAGKVALAMILVVAFAARMGVVLVRGDQLQSDPDGYRALAQSVRDGKGFVAPEDGRPTAYRPPLYPLFLAALPFSLDRTMALGATQALLGTLSVGLLPLIVRRVTSQRGALLAAAILAVDPLSVLYAAYVMTETLFTALVLCVVLLVAKPLRTVGHGAAAGIAFGLAALCRPTVWPWGGLLALAWGCSQTRMRSFPPLTSARWRIGAAVVSGVVLVVAPWAIRNAIHFGTPILTTTHGGYTLFLANNPVVYAEEVNQPWGVTWEEAPAGRTQADWYAGVLRQREKALGPEPSEVKSDRWMAARAWRQIAAEPVTFLRSCGFRLRRLWNIAPLGASARQFPQTLLSAIRAFYVAVFAVAFVGGFFAVQTIRKRRAGRLSAGPDTDVDDAGGMTFVRTFVAALLFLVALSLVHSLYWSNARMRTPAMPFVAMLAALAVARPEFGTRSAGAAAEAITRELPSCRRSAAP